MSYYGSVAEPKKAFGEGTPALEAFYKAQLKMAPGAVNLLNISKQITEPYVKYYKTTLPDGFTAKMRVYDTKDTRIQISELDDISIKYRHKVNSGKEKDVSLAAHIAHMTDGFVNREMCGRCNYDNNILSPAKHLIDLCKPNAKEFNYDKANRIEKLWYDHNYTSIAGVDHISPLNIRSFSREYLEALSVLVDDILDRPSFHMLSCHDEWMCHPNYMNWGRQTYIETTAEIAESNMIDKFVSDITGTNAKVERYSDDLGQEIRQGNYAIN